MKILIAEDEAVSRCLLEELLASWGFEVTAVSDGAAAWEMLRAPDAPLLAVLDWQMPGLDGVEVCGKLRSTPAAEPPYLILLTARQDKASIVAGLQAGANDYVSKPFHAEELRARINVGAQMVALQQNLVKQVNELRRALEHVKQLQGILPICMYCKKIRNDKQYWESVENYLTEHAGVLLSHGICPDCLERAMSEVLGHTDNGGRDGGRDITGSHRVPCPPR